nr:MAG TPA_asm: hypothetical protein [Caudoviricetes sp.]
MEQYVKIEELVDFLKICFKFKWGDENEDEIMARIMTALYGFKKFTKEQIIRTAWEEAKYTKPTKAVNVRGFVRHYKSGKVVYIKPFTRYSNCLDLIKNKTYIFL